MIKVAAHPPALLPWVGFWNKAWQADSFICMTHIVASKGANGDFHNRMQIDGKALSIPVTGDGPLNSLRMDLRGLTKLARTIEQTLCSRSNPYRHRVEPFVSVLVDWRGDNLAALTQTLMGEVSKALGLPTSFLQPVVQHSDTKTGRLRGLIECTVGTDVEYYSGAGGREYLDLEEFKHPVKFQRVTSPYGGNSVLQLIAREEDPAKFISTCAVWE